MKYQSIKPGKVWLDTEGKRIHAHGGSVININGLYYWYGENKEKTDGKNGIWHWGVRCYSSDDLYNWEDRGLIIPPVLDNQYSSLHPSSQMDRPHIIYNKPTQKYVCWIKVMHSDQTQTVTILRAEDILGPYEMVREGFRPLGMNAGDFDLVIAEDGKAYYYFERIHSELICADLTEDYLDVTGYYSTHFPRKCPPFVREGVAHFTRNRKQYLITSGTTWYYPNPSELAVADSWHGPFQILGNPHPEDLSNTSWHSQISSVFKVNGKKDLYIACADRWLPERTFLPYEAYADNYEAMFDENSGKTEDWSYMRQLMESHGVTVGDGDNTSQADYVWLPFCFYGDMGILEWKDEWNIEDYEDIY